MSFPKRFTVWWNDIGSKLPYTDKCVALAAYQFGRASRDLESRPTVRAKRPVQQPQAKIARLKTRFVGWCNNAL